MTGLQKRMLEASLKEYSNNQYGYHKWSSRLRIEGHTAKMGLSATAVYTILMDHRNNVSGLCCPSIRTLASELSCDTKTISKALNTLENLGYIMKIKSDKGAKRNNLGQIKEEPNQYIIVPLNFVDKHGAVIEETKPKAEKKQSKTPAVVIKDPDIMDCITDEDEAKVQEEIKVILKYAYGDKEVPEISTITTAISKEARNKGSYHKQSVNPAYKFIKASLKEGREFSIKEVVNIYRETIGV